MALLTAFAGIAGLAVYYFYVLSLYRDRDVSEAYDWERPSFFGRDNVDPPYEDSGGLSIRELVPLRFKLYSCSENYSLRIRVYNQEPGELVLLAGKKSYTARFMKAGVNETVFPVPLEELSCVPGDTLELFLKTSHPVKVLSVGFEI